MKSKLAARLLTALYTVAIALLIITFSIGLPIYVRPFYYAHIGPLDLVEDTGKTVEQVAKDTDRDNFMTAEQALEYGLVDKVLAHRA